MVIDQFFYKTMSKKLKADFAAADPEARLEAIIFDSEVTEARIRNAAATVKEFGPDVVVP